ncbi:SMC family ATPase [Arthrobacter sp. StoSoilB5]|uniref:AAA family ATPase n=1 Tax=Arthrobacter sp. StoSoilB5 TaxID=2830992 RepID=UPI001CC51ABE|nr:SMC family ATPase [Arthrobacter sp. StoSoilB5]BCW46041.1 nuclease SbcCD subunit C [Arthrobacter sp. StoSoilB5]
MRIHRLDIEAFGPFATAQHIDFDQLSAQGLFLLNGATGAGKTSILDAICFALYGSVPGARQEGKRLRSDHAAPGAEPRVVCEFSARGRRFEVSRSPAWERPSARGRNGFTTQQAKTLLREWVSGGWEEKSSRNDEVGAELSDLLGMDRDQFTRVVMLPQGDFAAFLRSKAADRLELLQKLFGTQRFEAVERQIARQAAEAARAVEDNAAELTILLGRAASEREQLGLSDAVTDVETAAGAPEVWLAALETELLAESVRRNDEASAADARAVRLAEQLQEEQDKAQRHARLAAGMQRRVLHELAAARALENKEKLGGHRRAAVLGGQLEAVDATEGKYRSALGDRDKTREQLLSAGLDAAHPVAALEKVKSTLAVLDARLPDERRMEDVASRLAAKREEHSNHLAAAQAAAESLERLRADESALRAGMEPLEPLAAQADDLEREAAAAAGLVSVVSRHAAAAAELKDVSERHTQARSKTQDLRQAWLDVREARLANAAGELAAALAPGHACPVCGSNDHPSPAAAARSALSIAQEEDQANQLFEASEKALERIAEEVSSAAQLLAGLAAQGGSADPDESAARLVASEAAALEARKARGALDKLRSKQDALAKRITLLQEEHSGSMNAAMQAASAVEVLQEQHRALEDELEGLRQGFPSLRERSGALTSQRLLLQAEVDAVNELQRAGTARMEALAALERALPGSGFSSAEDVRRELLSASDVVALEKAFADFEAEAARLDELFAGEDLVMAAKEVSIGELPLPEDELSVAKTEAARAMEAAKELALSAGLASKAARSVQRIRVEYRNLAEAGREPRQHATLLAGLADTLRGAGENNYRMSLNSYVLAARLEQVAIAASERLVAMSDGRYTLQHTDARAARNQKSGLGLEVVDEWTGQRRDTSTLSGGESFMASLSLALGLADVVQQEAGGVDIETLFVDEGFGSLDEQALEQVMDALEGLRDGGRVVGLVSHVAEMKQRISSQLHVVKGRHGSSVVVAEAMPA